MQVKIISTITVLLFISFFIYLGYTETNTKKYCVYVEDKFISSPYDYRSGKVTVTAPAIPYLIFKTDSLPFLKIPVSINLYYSIKIKQRICFDLTVTNISEYK